MLQLAAVSQSPLESVFHETVAAWAGVQKRKKRIDEMRVKSRTRKLDCSFFEQLFVDRGERSAL